MFLDILNFTNFLNFLGWAHGCFTTLLSYFTDFFEILFNNSLIKYSLMIGIVLFIISMYMNIVDFVPFVLLRNKRTREIHDLANSFSTTMNNRDIVSASYKETYNEHGYSKSYSVYGNHGKSGGVRK